MNTMNNNLDEQQFDLLADGELDEARRRNLIAGLDDTSDGWRKCALAFLEAQELKSGFNAMLQEPGQGRNRNNRQKKRILYWPTALAAVASFVIALALGMSLNNRDLPQEKPGAVANNKETPKENKPEILNPAVDKRIREIVNKADPLEIPVQIGQADQEWFDNLPEAMPQDVKNALQRTGYNVRRQKELLPYKLEDGRRIVVPVESYDIHYAGYEF
jgi:hypothetical protein